MSLLLLCSADLHLWLLPCGPLSTFRRLAHIYTYISIYLYYIIIYIIPYVLYMYIIFILHILYAYILLTYISYIYIDMYYVHVSIFIYAL